MYRGKVDEWRFYRNGFNLIHCSLVGKDRANILEVLPLPFDDEIKQDQVSDSEQMMREYEELRKSGLLGEIKE